MRTRVSSYCVRCNRLLPWPRAGSAHCDECQRAVNAEAQRRVEQSLAVPTTLQIDDTLHVTALRVTEHPVVLTDAQRLAVVTEIRELWEQMLGDPLHVVLDVYQRRLKKEGAGHG